MYYFDKKKKIITNWKKKKTKPVLRIRDQTKQQWVTGGRQREASHADRRQPSTRSLKILWPACLLPCPASRAASCVPERREHASSCTHIGTPKGMFSLHLHTHTTSVTFQKGKPPLKPFSRFPVRKSEWNCAPRSLDQKVLGELQASFLWAHNTHLLSAETLTDIFSWGREVLMGFGIILPLRSCPFETKKVSASDQNKVMMIRFWEPQNQVEDLCTTIILAPLRMPFLPPMYTCNLLAPNHGDWNLLLARSVSQCGKLLTASWPAIHTVIGKHLEMSLKALGSIRKDSEEWLFWEAEKAYPIRVFSEGWEKMRHRG